MTPFSPGHFSPGTPNYDKRPIVDTGVDATLCREGWAEILREFQTRVPGGSRCVLAVEVYPGIDTSALAERLTAALNPELTIRSEDAFLSPAALQAAFAEMLGTDPIFSFMQPWTIEAFFHQPQLERQRAAVAGAKGLVLIVGAGAAHLARHADLVVSANLSRWEIQKRQREHRSGNLGLGNASAGPAELYKTAFFLDWRVADRCRHAIYRDVDFFLDMNDEELPKMLAGDVLRSVMHATARRPFRVVPYFDPGPWGGQWMRHTFGLDEGPPNYAWGFDCVPEENSVLLGFGARLFELPAIVLVHEEPEALLGTTVLQRFGAEFPIRFDFLDTVAGGNLSLQVHPSDTYIRQHFGMSYTQDESYYLLHCEPGSQMFLGLKQGTRREAMEAALVEANAGSGAFPAEAFVQQWPTAAHDHFSIPAGTVHCSGIGNVVLEISATPYIFTFKLWDWGRNGLDGRPRPIHLEHGLANIRWDRTTDWVRRELVDQTTPLTAGEGWREERTGLHATQFLETRRHWFTAAVPHDTEGNLQVLNLVEGEQATLSSPDAAFAPMTLHFAETVIIPAAVGRYLIAPEGQTVQALATVKAYVR